MQTDTVRSGIQMFREKPHRRLMVGVMCAWVATKGMAAEDVSFDGAQKRLLLPPEVAHVTDCQWTAEEKTPEFVLIQDVHKHPEVQGHIASAILLGYHFWGVRKVFLEGAFSNVDVSVFENVTGPARPRLLRRLLQQGDLSGPELAGVLIDAEPLDGDSPFQLIGMEDPSIYRDNLISYQQVQSQRMSMLRSLRSAAVYGLRPEQLDRLILLVQLKMTPLDYEAYWREKRVYRRLTQFRGCIQAAERFYELVHIRSHIFLDRASRELPASTGTRLIVVGGFHTAVMAEELRKQHRSFVVLTPTVTQSGYEPLYEKHMMDNVSALIPPKEPFQN